VFAFGGGSLACRGRSTPWTTTTEVVPRAAARDRIRELRADDGGDILCFGSLTTWNPLLAALRYGIGATP
jgi:hypothetical protein